MKNIVSIAAILIVILVATFFITRGEYISRINNTHNSDTIIGLIKKQKPTSQIKQLAIPLPEKYTNIPNGEVISAVVTMENDTLFIHFIQ